MLYVQETSSLYVRKTWLNVINIGISIDDGFILDFELEICAQLLEHKLFIFTAIAAYSDLQ